MRLFHVAMISIKTVVLTLWILFSSVRFDAQGINSNTTSEDDQNPTAPPLHCYFCRSDYNKDCINKALSRHNEFVKQCNDETLNEFHKDLEMNPPVLPIPKPRDASGDKWLCYRMYTIDQTYTLRTCQKASSVPTGDEQCNSCNFKGVSAMCCSCGNTICNFKNSRGTQISMEPTLIFISTFIFFIYSIFTLFKIHVLAS